MGKLSLTLTPTLTPYLPTPLPPLPTSGLGGSGGPGRSVPAPGADARGQHHRDGGAHRPRRGPSAVCLRVPGLPVGVAEPHVHRGHAAQVPRRRVPPGRLHLRMAKKIVFAHFSRISGLYAAPSTSCVALFPASNVCRALIGACNPMLCSVHAFYVGLRLVHGRSEHTSPGRFRVQPSHLSGARRAARALPRQWRRQLWRDPVWRDPQAPALQRHNARLR